MDEIKKEATRFRPAEWALQIPMKAKAKTQPEAVLQENKESTNILKA